MSHPLNMRYSENPPPSVLLYPLLRGGLPPGPGIADLLDRAWRRTVDPGPANGHLRPGYAMGVRSILYLVGLTDRASFERWGTQPGAALFLVLSQLVRNVAVGWVHLQEFTPGAVWFSYCPFFDVIQRATVDVGREVARVLFQGAADRPIHQLCGLCCVENRLARRYDLRLGAVDRGVMRGMFTANDEFCGDVHLMTLHRDDFFQKEAEHAHHP